jgi:alkylated DNA repair protein (DNA oxidative demethylase)
MSMSDLFAAAGVEERIDLGPSAVLLKRFAETVPLVAEIDRIQASSAFRNMEMPGGFRMSVAMTNCGDLGWISDRSGYRYSATDPLTGRPWPKMPDSFRKLAGDAAAMAGIANFVPDCCLLNRYKPGTKLGLHQDRDEKDFNHPIVSVSIGIDAHFLWGGPKRNDRTKRHTLSDGDVVAWGGKSRMNFHGVETVLMGSHNLTGSTRINLTFRVAG